MFEAFSKDGKRILIPQDTTIFSTTLCFHHILSFPNYYGALWCNDSICFAATLSDTEELLEQNTCHSGDWRIALVKEGPDRVCRLQYLRQNNNEDIPLFMK